MKKLLIILSMVLTGCATTPKIEIQEVKVPVLKTCFDGKTIPTKPTLITDSLSEKEKVDVWLNGALRDVNVLKVYSDELRTFVCE